MSSNPSSVLHLDAFVSEDSEPFDISRGVLQGDILSQVVFIVGLCRHSDDTTNQMLASPFAQLLIVWHSTVSSMLMMPPSQTFMSIKPQSYYRPSVMDLEKMLQGRYPYPKPSICKSIIRTVCHNRRKMKSQTWDISTCVQAALGSVKLSLACIYTKVAGATAEIPFAHGRVHWPIN